MGAATTCWLGKQKLVKNNQDNQTQISNYNFTQYVLLEKGIAYAVYNGVYGKGVLPFRPIPFRPRVRVRGLGFGVRSRVRFRGRIRVRVRVRGEVRVRG